MLTIGILCIVLLCAVCVAALVRAWDEHEEEHDDGIIRALQDWPEVLSGLKPQGYCPGPVPAVFHSNRKPFEPMGGNAHQRRLWRRYIERAAA